jgi:hypothetical protein
LRERYSGNLEKGWQNSTEPTTRLGFNSSYLPQPNTCHNRRISRIEEAVDVLENSPCKMSEQTTNMLWALRHGSASRHSQTRDAEQGGLEGTPLWLCTPESPGSARIADSSTIASRVRNRRKRRFRSGNSFGSGGERSMSVMGISQQLQFLEAQAKHPLSPVRLVEQKCKTRASIAGFVGNEGKNSMQSRLRGEAA